MGKLKLYNLESEWLNDKPTHDDSTVSYVLETQKSEFRENGGYIKAVYNVTSTTNTQLFYHYNYGQGQDHANHILEMWIDGNNVAVSTYATLTPGAHTVTFLMKKTTSYNAFFSNCTALTSCDLSHLDASNVTDMSNMFTGCVFLKFIDLTNLDTSNVIKMSAMFNGCSNLISIDLSNFNTSKVYYMDKMFSSCRSLTSLDVTNFDTSNVYDMDWMFQGCENLTSLDLGNFSTSHVRNMKNMFGGCFKLNELNINNFDTHSVTDMSGMFRGANFSAATQIIGLENFDTSKVTNMSEMFAGCNKLTSLDLSNFDTSKVTNMSEMFARCTTLTSVTMTSPLSSSLSTTDMFYDITTTGTFYYNKVNDYSKIQKVLPPTWNMVDPNTTFTEMYMVARYSPTSTTESTMLLNSSFNNTQIEEMYIDDVKQDSVVYSYKFSTLAPHTVKYVMYKENTTSLNQMFQDCTTLLSLDLGSIDASQISSVSDMCSGCTNMGHLVYFNKTKAQAPRVCYDLSLENILSIDFSQWDTSNVTSMSGLCSQCSAVSMIAFSETMNTSNMTNMHNMFNGCSGLTSIDLSSFDTSNVTDMCYMFNNCKYLTSVKMTHSVDKVTLATNMFYGTTVTALKNFYYNGAYSYTTIIDQLTSYWTAVDINCAPEFTGTYKGNSGGTATPIFGSEFDLSQVKEVYINDTKQSTVSSAYTFSSSGSNTVRCVLYADKFTDASFMFNGCGSITALNVSQLDTSNVTDMSYMFYGCSGLTSASTLDISSFNTSKVTDMSYMFCYMSGEIRFPQNFGSKATNMSYMFMGNASVPTTRNIDLRTFNTQNIENFSHFIYDAKTLSSVTINYLNTSASTDMTAMFAAINVVSTNRPVASLNTKYFDTSNVTNMSHMFECWDNVTSLDVSNFNTSNVTNMSYMFSDCDMLTSLDLSSFDTSNVTNMSHMFNYCGSLTSMTQVISWETLDTSNVTDMNGMFSYCRSLTSLDLSHFETSNVTNMSQMFNECSGLTSLDLSNFDTSNVTNMSMLFSNCRDLTSLDLSNFDTSNVTDMSEMFSNCRGLTSLDLSNFDTSNVLDMNSMFRYCIGLTSLDVSNFDTSNVTNMGMLFSNCNSLTSMTQVIGWETLDTSNVTNMYGMFSYCSGLTSLDLRHFDTSNVTNMSTMFDYCSGLTSLDLTSFDTSKVTNMSMLFNYCSGLTSLDLSNFDTSTVTDMSYMFYGCSGLTSLDLRHFDTSNVTDMNSMFQYCRSLTSLDLSSFDTSKVTNMNSMFNSCSKLTSVTMTSPLSSSLSTTYMFDSITTTGTFYYNGDYDYSKIQEVLPVQWYLQDINGPQKSYTINLNNQWQLSTTVTNPDSSLYEGVYESFSNKGVNYSIDKMTITINGYTNFKLYIRSYAESTYDYVMVSQLDQDLTSGSTGSTYMKASTSGKQNSNTAITAYTLVEYTDIPRGTHIITVGYRKDQSQHNNDDRGYLLIPKNQ